MSLIEIVLIILGAIVLVFSYLLPAGKNTAEAGVKIDEGLIRGLVEKEVREAKEHINDMVDETLTYSMEKTERTMERLTNEKIMAVNEYSEQVLESINKNHQEVIFLYDMLNDKHEAFVGAVSEASKKIKDIRQEIQDIEITVKDAIGIKAEMPEQIENIQGAEERNLETEAAAAAEGNGFVPIAPKKAVDLNRILQEVKSGEGAGEVVQQRKESSVEGQSYNNNEQILRLHKLGKSQTAIAKDLGLGVGEVKLVIDLFEQAK